MNKKAENGYKLETVEQLKILKLFYATFKSLPVFCFKERVLLQGLDHV